MPCAPLHVQLQALPPSNSTDCQAWQGKRNELKSTSFGDGILAVLHARNGLATVLLLAVSQRFKLRLCDVASTSPARQHLEGLTRSLGCHVLMPQAHTTPPGNLIKLSLPDSWHYFMLHTSCQQLASFSAGAVTLTDSSAHLRCSCVFA